MATVYRVTWWSDVANAIRTRDFGGEISARAFYYMVDGDPVIESITEPCNACGQAGPSHNGSRNCESGSIASGGTRAHCACDVCF